MEGLDSLGRVWRLVLLSVVLVLAQRDTICCCWVGQLLVKPLWALGVIPQFVWCGLVHCYPRPRLFRWVECKVVFGAADVELNALVQE